MSIKYIYLLFLILLAPTLASPTVTTTELNLDSTSIYTEPAAVTNSEPARETKVIMGLGMEIRARKMANPEFTRAQYLGLLYLRINFQPLAAQFEFSRENRRSSDGSLKITSDTNFFGTWGRYQFDYFEYWHPFIGAGTGAYLDQVKTKFERSSDTRFGIRGFGGLAAGTGIELGDRFILESEARVAAVQHQVDPQLSMIVSLSAVF